MRECCISPKEFYMHNVTNRSKGTFRACDAARMILSAKEKEQIIFV